MVTPDTSWVFMEELWILCNLILGDDLCPREFKAADGGVK